KCCCISLAAQRRKDHSISEDSGTLSRERSLRTMRGFAMPKTLTPEQENFLSRFLENKSRRKQQKLTTQYKDFLRRKTKVLGEIYKLAPDDPQRQALEDLVAQIDQSKEGLGGTPNFKHAYEALEDVKTQARRAGRGLPALTVQDVEQKIQRLSRIGL